MGTLLGKPGGGGSFRDSEGYERMTLWMGIPLYGGSVGQPGVGSPTEHFEVWLKGALEVGSLCGSSVKGTWRGGSLAGDPEGYVEKALETGISFHRGPIWGTWRRVHLLGTMRAGWRGSGDRASLSIEAPLKVPQEEFLHCGLWTIC